MPSKTFNANRPLLSPVMRKSAPPASAGDFRQIQHPDGDIPQFIDEPSRQRRRQPLANLRVARNPHQLVKLLVAEEKIEPVLAP